MEHKLESRLEAVLFALGREVDKQELASTLQVTEEVLMEAIEHLKEKYHIHNPIVLMEVEEAISLVTNKVFYDDVSLFVENSKRRNLSKACLETLTIIAYNPKITKAEIEKIRGVSSDFAVAKLLECGLIEELARLSVAGRPAIYGVTKEFLKNCDMKQISDLPDFENLRIQDEQMMVNDVMQEKTEQE